MELENPPNSPEKLGFPYLGIDLKRESSEKTIDAQKLKRQNYFLYQLLAASVSYALKSQSEFSSQGPRVGSHWHVELYFEILQSFISPLLETEYTLILRIDQ